MPNEEVLDILEGSVVAGGEAYVNQQGSDIITRSDADRTVSSWSELDSALGRSGVDVIWMDDDIDMTGNEFRLSGQILAGDRGQDGSDGPLLYTNSKGQNSVGGYGGSHRGSIELRGDCHLTGIRFRGATHDAFDHPEYSGYIPSPAYGSRTERDEIYTRDRSRGITVSTSNGEISNCEIYGFATQAISVGSHNNPRDTHIHHCHIHDNMQNSMGYGVDVRRGNALVEFCYFNGHRHALNGGGRWNCSYTLRYSLLGPANSSHVVDMHRLGNNISSASSDFNDRDYIGNAGGNLVIENNTFLNTTLPDFSDSEVTRRANVGGEFTVFSPGDICRDIAIRGVPWPRDGAGCSIKDNRTLHHGPPGFDNQEPYRSPKPDIPFIQQVRSGGLNVPNSRRNSRNFSDNFEISGNVYDSENEGDFDASKGAPVDIHGGTSVGSLSPSRLPRQRGFPRARGEEIVRTLNSTDQ